MGIKKIYVISTLYDIAEWNMMYETKFCLYNAF